MATSHDNVPLTEMFTDATDDSVLFGRTYGERSFNNEPVEITTPVASLFAQLEKAAIERFTSSREGAGTKYSGILGSLGAHCNIGASWELRSEEARLAIPRIKLFVSRLEKSQTPADSIDLGSIDLRTYWQRVVERKLRLAVTDNVDEKDVAWGPILRSDLPNSHE